MRVTHLGQTYGVSTESELLMLIDALRTIAALRAA